MTATVESVPLITASILSKKLAAGLGALMLDVKCGNGAFMDSPERANELARSLVEVAVGAGMPTTALVTDMNQPLASAAGNAVEVRNAADFLTGKARDVRLLEVTLALAAEMLVSGGLAPDVDEASSRALAVLEDGSAAERFNRMVADLGGPLDFLGDPDRHLAKAPVVVPCLAGQEGYVAGYDTRAIGLSVVALGGGRTPAGRSRRSCRRADRSSADWHESRERYADRPDPCTQCGPGGHCRAGAAQGNPHCRHRSTGRTGHPRPPRVMPGHRDWV